MKQVLQSLITGKTEAIEIPCPAVKTGHLLIRTGCSLISGGTERMLIDFGKAGWIGKARKQPEKVRQVLDKIKTDGFHAALQAVRTKLDQPLPLGYCNVGMVLDVGDGVAGFSIGDRVASNGKHAEVVAVPVNLCAKVPDSVPDEAAAFTVLGAVALQGLRLVQPTLGEAVVVTGLGVIGLLTIQLLRAHGCRVLGIDPDESKLHVARQFGAEIVNLAAGEDPAKATEAFSRGRGVDAVLITASTHSSVPVHQAAQMCRKRGRIVLVGITGLELHRSDFYEKELSFQVSCSYGPGRYDPFYEEKGQDYPIGFVRWTAQRNFEAVLDMLADGRLDVKPLISQRFPIAEAEKAYAAITRVERSLGVLLEYPGPEPAQSDRTIVLRPPGTEAASKPVVSVIGAGNYAVGSLLPALKEAGVRLRVVATRSGVTSLHAGRTFGFEEATTNPARVLTDPETSAAVIVTRHDTHARFVCEALKAGKHVFVEKPLCLTLDELKEIEHVYLALSTQRSALPLLMVGFNRRFSPHARRIKALLSRVPGPKAFVITVNAGQIPPDHWTQDTEIGGGRILGEACHFIDLLRYLTGAPFDRWTRLDLENSTRDTTNLQLLFADGSIGTIHYFANGSRRFPKERLEVFCGGRVLQLANFRKLRGYGWPGFRTMNLWSQDKGQNACILAFLDAIRHGGPAPTPFEELIEVSRVTLELARSDRAITDKRMGYDAD